MLQHTSQPPASQASPASIRLSGFFVRLLLIAAIGALCVLALFALSGAHITVDHVVGMNVSSLAVTSAPNVLCPGAPIHC